MLKYWNRKNYAEREAPLRRGTALERISGVM